MISELTGIDKKMADYIEKKLRAGFKKTSNGVMSYIYISEFWENARVYDEIIRRFTELGYAVTIEESLHGNEYLQILER